MVTLVGPFVWIRHNILTTRNQTGRSLQSRRRLSWNMYIGLTNEARCGSSSSCCGVRLLYCDNAASTSFIVLCLGYSSWRSAVGTTLSHSVNGTAKTVENVPRDRHYVDNGRRRLERMLSRSNRRRADSRTTYHPPIGFCWLPRSPDVHPSVRSSQECSTINPSNINICKRQLKTFL